MADSTRNIRLMIREEVIGLVVEGKCYRFAGMMVCEFKGRKLI